MMAGSYVLTITISVCGLNFNFNSGSGFELVGASTTAPLDTGVTAIQNSCPSNTTCNVTAAGNYTVAVNYSIPYIAAGSSADSSVTTGASELQVLVKLETVTKLTLSGPGTTQPTLSGSVNLLCDEGDVIEIVPSSSAAADNALNAVKGIINIYQGV